MDEKCKGEVKIGMSIEEKRKGIKDLEIDEN